MRFGVCQKAPGKLDWQVRQYAGDNALCWRNWRRIAWALWCAISCRHGMEQWFRTVKNFIYITDACCSDHVMILSAIGGKGSSRGGETAGGSRTTVLRLALGLAEGFFAGSH